VRTPAFFCYALQVLVVFHYGDFQEILASGAVRIEAAINFAAIIEMSFIAFLLVLYAVVCH
jgi:hypothetical protein